jgi:hypothetical protein
VGDWTGPHTVTKRGPFQKKTAIVVRRDTNGWVRVFKVFAEKDHRPVAQYNSSDGARMIILENEEYCWIMGNATAKYVE